MSEPALSIEQVRVVAGGRTILSIDELSLARGELLAVLGPNGAGKSTLLKVCLGLRRPTRGRVTVLGQPVHRLRGLALSRLRSAIGYVPQGLTAGSHLPLTVREVVAIGRAGRRGLGRPMKRADWRVTDDWIVRLGLQMLAHEPYAHLSGGEQRKTLIARAMAQEPRMLLLDEPTAFLDLGWRERIVATLEQLCQETRLAMILVCHELEVLPACCRRLVLLEAGRVSAHGTPEDVLTNTRVAALYGAGLRVLHAGGRHAVIPAAAGDD